MKKITISELSKYIGKKVEIRGWVYNLRNIGKIWFIILRDGTGLVQGVVVKGEATDSTFQMEQTLNKEDSVILTGIVKEEPRSIGGYEMSILEIKIINPVSEEFPISSKEHGADFLMSNRHLWLRSKRQNAIMKIRHRVVKSIRDFFDNHDFVLIDSPIFTSNAVEGTTNLFEVGYFERTAYLTQSGQLYQEAGATAFGKTYCFGPCFRAEKSKTRRHLTEFWMVEPEMAFVDLEENIEWSEKLVAYIIKSVLDNCNSELNSLGRDIKKLEDIMPPFPKLTYKEAVKILNDKGTSFEYGNDLGAPDETLLSNQFEKPVIIYNWPAEIKAFYMKRDDRDSSIALGMDMIAPEGFGEIIGGGQREEDLTLLTDRIRHHDLPLEPFKWYIDLRKYGSVPHSGFGLGLERTVAWICGTRHIRETIPFPRTMSRLEP
ncbi:MAG: asparagine--tRNA ligase [Candidatus Marinimicrobia bacterium]|nr:asparagine--tRNA ligase [Candidatus Neomarinimicrobiota bacterium]